MNRGRVITSIRSLISIMLSGLITMPVLAEEKAASSVETGKAIALKLCQACHTFSGADQAGTTGPPFVSMSQRFPQRKRLQDIIYDAQKSLKPHTMMPPFGRHGFVDKQDTKMLIDFLYTL